MRLITPIKRITLISIAILLFSNLPAANVAITTIEQLDDLAEFSFSIMSDNKGYSPTHSTSTDTNTKNNGIACGKMVDWISANNAFCIGSGDHIFPNRDLWINVMKDNAYFNNHYYPNIGDHDNETKLYDYNGVTGSQSSWGRGWVILKALNNFFARNTAIDQITFRPKEATQVLSNGVYYDDQLVDYYARRTQGQFTFHIISIHYGDASAFAPRSKSFMLNKLQEIATFKTDRDIVVVVTHCMGKFFANAMSQGYMNQAETDIVMTNADIVTDASNHIYQRHMDYDNKYAGIGAMWVNTGAVADTGDNWGYVDFHVFDNPPRFTMQFIDIQNKDNVNPHVRKLLVGPKKYHSSNVTDAETIPYMKYVNGPIVPVNWSSFPTDGTVPEIKPVVSFNTPSSNVNVAIGSNLYVKVDAADADGTVSVVKLYKNGVQIARTEPSAPYEWNAAGQNDLELKALPAGSFSLKAIATDNNGLTGEATINVTVSNPSPNLVLNPSFETGGVAPTSWTLATNATGSTTAFKTGTASLKLNNFTSGNVTQTITVSANTTYDISVWVYNLSVTTGDIIFDTNDVFDGTGQGQFVVSPGQANAWTKKSGRFTTGATVSPLKLRIFSTNLVGTAYLDDVVLSVVPNASPFITSVALANATVGSAYSYTITAMDNENNTLTYSAVPPLPTWLTFTPATRLLTGTPSASHVGAHNVTLRVNDGSSNADQSFVITVASPPDPYESWKLVNNVTQDSGDADGDGVVNLMEFALGGNPNASDALVRTPEVEKTTNGVDFKFHRSEADVIYIVEKSTDLQTWIPHITNPGSAGNDVTVSVPNTEMSNGKLFLRLKVQK